MKKSFCLHSLLNLETGSYSQRCYDRRDFQVPKPWILCLPSLTETSQPGCYFTNITGNVFGDFRGGHNASSIIIVIYNLCQKKRHVHFFIVNKNNNLYLFAFCRLRRLDTKVKRHYYIKYVRCIGIIGQLVTKLIIICLNVIRCNFLFFLT